MSLLKVADQEEAVRLLGQADASGLGRAGWARRQGIDPRSLNFWRGNLAGKGRVPAGLRLVELVPRPSAADSPDAYLPAARPKPREPRGGYQAPAA